MSICEYALGPGADMAMRVENGRLLAQVTGQPPFELFAEKPDQFFLKAVDAQVRFTRSTAGTVDGLVLTQGGRDMPAPRK